LNENIYEGGLINSSRAILFPENSKKHNNIYEWRETLIMALSKAKKDLMIN
jgi:N-acetylglucosamine kinase-like BadF-type ATPase